MTFLRFLWKMRLSNCGPVITHSTSSRSCLCNLFRAAAVLCVVFFIGTAFVATNHKERISRWRPVDSVVTTKPTRLEKISRWRLVDSVVTTKPTRLESVSGLGPVYSTDAIKSNKCKNHCKPFGSESLPTGIVSRTSDLEMQLLGGPSKQKRDVKTSKSLLAIAVGLKQKNNVDQIVKKFPSSGFSVMLFHYDGAVNEWRDLQWSQNALHVSAINQTKWWFAKRFLHPDIVAEYSYIFLWDEDLGVEHFDPGRYLSIVQEEGLEISQPALDQTKSEVHHQITVRSRRKKVHRRIYKFTGGGRCYENSTGPPCTGWVEMMAPVFSKAAWRCAWYMIQNDLIHAWGLDTKLGYCAQGDRTKNVGVVDAEYIVHQGIPTLGGSDKSKSNTEAHTHPLQLRSKVPPSSGRYAVRIRSYEEQKIFKQRWEKAVAEDKCWIDPYSETRRT